MPTATAKVVPSGAAADIDAKATALAGEALITSATVDPGIDLVVDIAILATDATEGGAGTAITNAIAAVGGLELKGGAGGIVTAP